MTERITTSCERTGALARLETNAGGGASDQRDVEVGKTDDNRLRLGDMVIPAGF